MEQSSLASCRGSRRRRGGDVCAILDDRRFARADSDGRRMDSATGLKAYLDNSDNTRHRKTAEQELDELDDRLFAKISNKEHNGVQVVEAYRAAFPAGKHVGKLAEARDHRMFADAKRAASLDDNPGPARAYLADAANT